MSETDTDTSDETANDNGEQGSTDTGGAEFNWKEQVPEFAREWDEVKNAESFGDFISWADNARSLVGQSVRIPGEDAGQEDWDSFSAKLLEKNANVMVKPRNAEEYAAAMAALGKPSDAAAYKFEMDGFEPDDDRVAEFKKMAHDADLTGDQYTKFMEGMAKAEMAAAEARGQARTASTNELRQDWGAAYDQNVSNVQNFLSRMGAPDSFIAAEKAGELDAADYKWLHDLASRIGGEGSPGAGNTSEKHVMTPADATVRMAEIRNNLEHPFNLPNGSPGKQEAIEQMIALQRMATGNGTIKPFQSS